LLGFDLLIDLIAMINGTYRVMVEVDIDKYEERRRFYDQLRSGPLQIGPAAMVGDYLIHPIERSRWYF
jgi:hypothetical protein